jgi:glycosyltransferase involved in cell wall biosynthesis
MRVVLFFTYGVSIKSWVNAGILSREIKIYKELCKNGVEVLFVTYGDASDRQWQSELGSIKLLPVYEDISKSKIKTIEFLKTFLIPFKFRDELQSGDIFKTNQVFGSWVAVLSKLIFKKPLLVRCGYEFYDFTIRQNSSFIFRKFAYIVSFFAYKQATKINVATELDQLFVNKIFSVELKNIHIFPNWIDIELFSRYEYSRKNLLFVGRLNKQKNLPLLFKALKGTGFELDIAGEGELHDSLKLEASKLQIKVNFLGVVDNDQLYKLYNTHSIFILCSKYEGNPKTMLEAMSCGSAVIGTNVTGICNIINNGENGLLVNENYIELREAICSLSSDSGMRESLGRNARKSIVKNNSLKCLIQKELELYRELIDNNLGV